MTTRIGEKIGFSDAEQAEFNRALKQQLLVQTPLQVLLETLFSRLQSQANLFNDLTRRVERMEAKEIDGQELLERVQLCEGKLSEFTESKLSPFNQQDITARLEELEQQVGGQRAAAAAVAAAAAAAEAAAARAAAEAPVVQEDVAEPSHTLLSETGDVLRLEARLAEIEGKLKGVYNLSGKLIALEGMAAELGFEIPDLEYNLGGLPPPVPTLPLAAAAKSGGPTPRKGASAGGGLVVIGQSSPRGKPTASPRGGTPGQGQDRAERDRESRMSERAGQSAGSAGSGPSQDREPHMAERAGQPEGRASAAGQRTEIALHIQKVAEDNEALQAVVQALRTSLGDQVLKLTEAHGATVQRVDALNQAKADLAEEVAAVKAQARREPEVSFADFSKVQGQAETVVRRVQSVEEALAAVREGDLTLMKDVIADLQDAVERADAPRDIDKLFHQRISTLEAKVEGIRNEVQVTISDMMEDAATLNELEGIAIELDGKASTQDVRLLAQQQSALAQSVNGMAEWLSVRPETSDGSKGTGASMTKFKCLTCDREMKTQTGGANSSERQQKGKFLPKLDSAQGKQSAPVGPGLNAAEMRSSTTKPTGHDFEVYGDGKHTSPSRTPRTPNGRVAVQMPAGSLKLPPGPRTPVFI